MGEKKKTFLYKVDFLKRITKHVSPVNTQVRESTATSPAAKVKYSSTKILQQRGRSERQTERVRPQKTTVPLLLSLQLSAAPPSSGMYNSAQAGEVSVGLDRRPVVSYRTRCRSNSGPG